MRAREDWITVAVIISIAVLVVGIYVVHLASDRTIFKNVGNSCPSPLERGEICI